AGRAADAGFADADFCNARLDRADPRSDHYQRNQLRPAGGCQSAGPPDYYQQYSGDAEGENGRRPAAGEPAVQHDPFARSRRINDAAALADRSEPVAVNGDLERVAS